MVESGKADEKYNDKSENDRACLTEFGSLSDDNI